MSASRTPVFRVLVMVLVLASLMGVAAAAVAPPFAFEDRNDNGVFDGSDVDITQLLLTERMFHTAHSVVVTGGPMKIPDPQFKRTGSAGGAYIRAGKNITVLTSILAPFYAGTIVLWADDSVRVGNAVTLQGRDYVDVYAGNDVTIGSNVKLLSSGGSANHGAAMVYSGGSVSAGANLQMTTLTEATIYSVGGDVALGTGSRFTSTRSSVSLAAATGLVADGMRLRGARASLTTMDGPISARSGNISVPRSGVIQITAYRGTVDLRGTTFSVTPQVTGTAILR